MAQRKGLGRGLESLISGGMSSSQKETPSQKAATKSASKAKSKASKPASKKPSKPVAKVAKKSTSPRPSTAAKKATKKAPAKVTAPTVDKKSTAPAAKPAIDSSAQKSATVVSAPAPAAEAVKNVSSSNPELATGLFELPLTKVVPNPHQPRKEFSEDSLNELAESIRAEGLLQPIVVRRVSDHYELIAGERRWRACHSLKMKTIPARVIQASQTSSAVLSLIENLQRENLNPIEEALGYASLLRDFGLTQESVSERVGKGRASVANSLRLLQLEKEIQSYLGKGHLSVGHAKVLLGVTAGETRLLVARQSIEKGWSVRELERQIQLKPSSSNPNRSSKSISPSEATAIHDLERQIASRLSTKVQLKHTPKKGRIIIDYFGNDDLQRIMEKMGLE